MRRVTPSSRSKDLLNGNTVLLLCLENKWTCYLFDEHSKMIDSVEFDSEDEALKFYDSTE